MEIDGSRQKQKKRDGNRWIQKKINGNKQKEIEVD